MKLGLIVISQLFIIGVISIDSFEQDPPLVLSTRSIGKFIQIGQDSHDEKINTFRDMMSKVISSETYYKMGYYTKEIELSNRMLKYNKEKLHILVTSINLQCENIFQKLMKEIILESADIKCEQFPSLIEWNEKCNLQDCEDYEQDCWKIEYLGKFVSTIKWIKLESCANNLTSLLLLPPNM